MKDTKNNPDETEAVNFQPSRLVEILMLGTAGMATTVVVQPWDVIKVRMQLSEQSYKSWYKAEQIYKYEGIRGLYSGLSAGFLRTGIYTTIRLSMHGYLLDRYKTTYKKIPSTKEHLLIAMMSSAAAALTVTPAEVAVVRMMADGYHRICHRNWPRRYHNVMDAFYKIFKAEGIRGLFRGGFLTVARAAFVSTTQTASYAQFKEYFNTSGRAKGFMIYVYSAMLSSLITAVISSPLDFLKTQYQATSERIRIRDIAINTARRYGYGFFWSGFTPYFIRITVYTVLLYYLLDYEYAIYKTRLAGNLKGKKFKTETNASIAIKTNDNAEKSEDDRIRRSTRPKKVKFVQN